MKPEPQTAAGPKESDRRMSPRHALQTRAAVWFDFGPEIGETCALKDISMTGFSVECNEWQLAAFLGSEGHAMYCVLLMGAAHFGCMARVAKAGLQHNSRVGFRFDAVPDNSIRLLEGLISYMAGKEAEQAT